MYDFFLHQHINTLLKQQTDIAGKDNLFYTRLIANAAAIKQLYDELYMHYSNAAPVFDKLLQVIITAHLGRPEALRQRDIDKSAENGWFLSNKITGMSLYVDRFCGNLQNLGDKLGYFEQLGVNLLHLMPLFESPAGESDGGYAVSDFRTIDPRFGTINDLENLQRKMQQQQLYLMTDIVLNHTSHRHAWAEKAKQGDPYHQDFFYFFNDRTLPDEYDRTMPEIFPESAPGSFTYVPECDKWVMTVFHSYQWDLNYRNPEVLVAMLDNIFFYANTGIDILRIDAPAFIWKEIGTTCQNLREAHTILRLLKQCVQVAAPGMALLGEAIVAPHEIMKYFGTEDYTARECDFAYNATHMAVQWDALATGDTRVMLAAQRELMRKPSGASWITYTRSHDDIGLGYDDHMIEAAGFNAYEHRVFLKNYYSGNYPGSPAKGALFGANPKTGDARISGSLASLCGLETAIMANDAGNINLAIRKILMMQAHSFFLGGIPMIFYGDEIGYTNDYRYRDEPGKSYDNRWMHRPLIDWQKKEQINITGSAEQQLFYGTQQLIDLRKKLDMVADHSNITWLTPHNIHVAGYLRELGEQRLFIICNFSATAASLTWYAFREKNPAPQMLYDHWSGTTLEVGEDGAYLQLEPYAFYILEPR